MSSDPIADPPLAGRSVLVTRPEDGAGGLSDLLREAGAEVASLPLTRIERLDPAALRTALRRLEAYDWMILTSVNGVSFVLEEAEAIPGCAERLARARIAVVGMATAAALRSRGIEPALVPLSYNAEELLAAILEAEDVGGRRLLLAVAEGAREVVPRGLREAGAEVDVVPVYRSTRDEEAAARVREVMRVRDVDLVVFTAGSGVHAFAAAVGNDACVGLPVASIGPATSMVADSYGMTVLVEGGEATIPGLVRSIVAHYIARHERME
jgi:uroporphyrinogen III methyltransferase / synthase